MRNSTFNLILLAALVSLLSVSLQASGPKALKPGELPEDSRLGALKDLNGYFPFNPPSNLEDWNKRSDRLKHRIATVLGLWPEPEKTPLNPVIHSSKSFDGYSVLNVFFESFPGFYVTGNLYMPENITGKSPGILCPHGHWSDGRFYKNANVANEIANGAERFVDGGQSPMQSRCVQLARMGCIVFHYDMIGYADSQQISYDLAHRFAKQRPHLSTGREWGFFGAKAEGLYQNIMGFQTWNSIRALDFLCSMPEIDQDRLGVTGASGGGTQTFLLAAIDERIDLSVPAVMVSTAMQGGCTCENTSGLRINTGNVELAALFAPKPQGVISADDWTVNMVTIGFPQLQKLYQLTGHKNKVHLKSLTHFGHNYNNVSRTAMYEWVNNYFKLGHKTPILEKEYKLLSAKEMTVWNDNHPKPKGGEQYEVQLLRSNAQQIARSVAALAADDPKKTKETMKRGWDVVIGRAWDEVGQVDWSKSGKKFHNKYIEMPGTIDNETYKESIPVVFLYPTKKWNGTTELILAQKGKSALYDGAGELKAEFLAMLENGSTVLGVDLLYQGEFLKDGQEMTQTRRVANTREAACFTQGYNHALCAQRVHDVMSSINLLKTFEEGPSKVRIHTLDGVDHIGLAAAVIAGEAVESVEISGDDFRFRRIESIRDPHFLPGAIRFGGVRGLKYILGISNQ